MKSRQTRLSINHCIKLPIFFLIITLGITPYAAQARWTITWNTNKEDVITE